MLEDFLSLGGRRSKAAGQGTSPMESGHQGMMDGQNIELKAGAQKPDASPYNMCWRCLLGRRIF